MATTETTPIRKWIVSSRQQLLFAIAGAVALLSVVTALGIFAVQWAQRCGEQLQSQENLKRIGEAYHAYDVGGRPLHQAIVNPDTGEPLLSWRVTLLPFLGEKELYDQIRLDERWDSEHNRQFWNKMPTVYLFPSRPNDGTTYYQVFHGDGALFGKPHKNRDGKFVGGTNNGIRDFYHLSLTIFAVEAAQPVNWMKPEDIPYLAGPDGPSAMDMGDHWRDGSFRAVMCDKSVATIVRKRRMELTPLEFQKFIDPKNFLDLMPRGCSGDRRRYRD